MQRQSTASVDPRVSVGCLVPRYIDISQGPTPPFASKFTPDGLHGNLLAVGDEEGSVRLFDTRRSLGHSEAMLSGAYTHHTSV